MSEIGLSVLMEGLRAGIFPELENKERHTILNCLYDLTELPTAAGITAAQLYNELIS
jgi:hypothetical protein